MSVPGFVYNAITSKKGLRLLCRRPDTALVIMLQDDMLRELRERMQQLMQTTAAQTDSSTSGPPEAALARMQASNEGLRKELKSLKADRQQVCSSTLHVKLPGTLSTHMQVQLIPICTSAAHNVSLYMYSLMRLQAM